MSQGSTVFFTCSFRATGLIHWSICPQPTQNIIQSLIKWLSKMIPRLKWLQQHFSIRGHSIPCKPQDIPGVGGIGENAKWVTKSRRLNYCVEVWGHRKITRSKEDYIWKGWETLCYRTQKRLFKMEKQICLMIQLYSF